MRREDSRLREHVTRVLHVVDRTTGGVPVATRTYIENSPAGIEHHVLSPHSSALGPAPVWDGVEVRHHDLGHGLVKRLRRVRMMSREIKPHVVHAHSSFAGVYARMAADRHRSRLVYTPHCYSFTRTDTGVAVRGAYWAIEWALGWRTDLVAACSPGEAALASRMRSVRSRVDVIPNVASVDPTPERRPTAADRRIKIGMLGRVSPQKDPRAYVEIVKRMRAAGLDVQPTWIGEPETAASLELKAAGVPVTGWLRGAELIEALANLDVYVHSAAWEGFPVAVLDAYSIGLPVIVRPIPAFGTLDAIQTTTDGMDALIAATESTAAFTTWRTQNRAAWAKYLSQNTRENQRAALTHVWTPR